MLQAAESFCTHNCDKPFAGNGSGMEALEAGWFNVLAKLKKQVFEQNVHISWERGSIYFDTVKIYPKAPHRKGKQGQAGLAVSRVVSAVYER